MYKPDNVDTGTDLNNKENCKNPTFVKTPKTQGGLYKEEVNTKPIVVENSSPAIQESLYNDPVRYREEMNKLWRTSEK